MNHQDFKSRPGFLYRTGERYYYLGKWICLECTDYEVTDSLYMYELAYKEHNLSDLNVYFQKIRAYSDFALVPPFNKDEVYRAQDLLLDSLNEEHTEDLRRQIGMYEECYRQY